ncbi:hypothetical protein C1878_12945 [Gordonibacter sp. 28C]|uniref:GrpB family protein n=1 Tax=Gordonibacter sp. 28C TaxID=2078569 RepID=UPI000DF85711|nr:GrpB family protein [Gordonibacter sp. 28C]RDB60946.1 hypothetical protein C1878_12945 [Gordonibacter sp. 28C]
MMAHRIILEKYNPAWPAEFEKIKRELDSVLGSTALAIEHVGSTSVPGLVAKPIIDIDVVIDGCFDETRRILESAGYRHEGNLGIEGREAFSYDVKAHLMKHHLYVCDMRSAELQRHLSFRNLLRANETARNEYARVKQAAAALHPHDVDAYTSSKGPFVENALSSIPPSWR